MLYKKTLLSFIFVLALVATSSGTLEPPEPWWRGNEGTTFTFQNWSFTVEGTTPDTWQNRYGHYTDPGTGLSLKQQGWFESVLDADGVYALSHQIDIVLPNNPTQEPDTYKDLLIYLVWRPLSDVVGGNLIEDPFLPNAPMLSVFPYTDKEEHYSQTNENGWCYSTYEIKIWPNPPREWISIKGNILVDYLAIDTRCVPEPATVAILIIGGFWAIRRRKLRS